LQNLVLATSSESPYSLSKELLSLYLDIDINEMQLYRITDHYGKSLASVLEDNKRLHPLPEADDSLYAMADGTMVLTREEQWKEAKLGRIFTGKNCLQIDGKSNAITASQYVSHLGNCKGFTQKMDTVLDDYGNLKERLIFITDGAIWIKNWIADAYPDAVSILDFYHVKEYLCQFAKDYFKDDCIRKDWINEQEERLLESKTQQVIDAIKALHKKLPNAATERIIEYYQSNINRMDYKYYVTIGKGIIGSGAIESAHRTVIQCRMKLSGQRWSKLGATNMLCLRTIKMNKQWNNVVQLIKSQYIQKMAA
jgi:hypothetical protein